MSDILNSMLTGCKGIKNPNTSGGTPGSYIGLPGDLDNGKWVRQDTVGGVISNSFYIQPNMPDGQSGIETVERTYTLNLYQPRTFKLNFGGSVTYYSSPYDINLGSATATIYDYNNNHIGGWSILKSASAYLPTPVVFVFDWELRTYTYNLNDTGFVESIDMPVDFNGIGSIKLYGNAPGQTNNKGVTFLFSASFTDIYGRDIWERNDDVIIIDDVFSINKQTTTNVGISCPFHTSNHNTFHFGGTLAYNTTDRSIMISPSTANKAVSTPSTVHFTDSGFSPNGCNINKLPVYSFCSRPGFFDTNTYIGDDIAGHRIDHNLKCKPGMVIYKNLDTNDYDWQVWHKSLNANNNGSKNSYINWNLTDGEKPDFGMWWNNTDPDKDSLYLGTQLSVNENGTKFMYMAFADNPNLSAFGDYIGNGSSIGPTINTKWKPSFVMIKDVDGESDWVIIDTFNGIAFNEDSPVYYPNRSSNQYEYFRCISHVYNGFQIVKNLDSINMNGHRYIYVAFRQLPCQLPIKSNEVYDPINVDLSISHISTLGFYIKGKLLGQTSALSLFSNAAKATPPYSTVSKVNLAFRPGVLDNIGYIGDNLNGRKIGHSLFNIPDLIMIKDYAENDWYVYHSHIGYSKCLYLNKDNPATIDQAWYTDPTDKYFTIRNHPGVNADGHSYISLLFGSIPGISKIGHYIGIGSTRPVDCQFTNGVCFVLIKRIDTNGNWCLFTDGLGMGIDNDIMGLLNINGSQSIVNTIDYIDPYAQGFTVTGNAPADMNALNGHYIYIAIAK